MKRPQHKNTKGFHLARKRKTKIEQAAFERFKPKFMRSNMDDFLLQATNSDLQISEDQMRSLFAWIGEFVICETVEFLKKRHPKI